MSGYTAGGMPIYDYVCPDGHRFEVVQRFSDDPVAVCEVCGKPVQRVLHAPAVHYKGKGFYATDYGRRKGGNGDKADGSSSESGAKEGAAASSGGSDGAGSKTESKTESKSSESKSTESKSSGGDSGSKSSGSGSSASSSSSKPAA